MATDTSSGSGGGNTMLAFLVGGLLVVVVVLGFFVFGGHLPGQNTGPSLNVNVHAPSVPTPKGG
jgi:hypothetical protein